MSDVVGMSAPGEAAFPGAKGKIVFEITGSNTNQIVVMKKDGSGLTQITTSGRNSDPAWSPDGHRIAFIHMDSPNCSLQTMSPQGLAVSTVMPFPAPGSVGCGAHPAWSPDGTKLLFTAGSSNGYGQSLWVVNVDGSGVTELTHFAAANVQSPAWSPNGSQIAFASDEGGVPTGSDPSTAFEIFVTNPDASGLTQLTHNSVGDFNPDWSPNGSQLVFQEDGFNRGIIVVNADGSNPTTVRSVARYPIGWARFSPDGKQIVFASAEPLCSGCRNVLNIFVMRADGRNPTPVTANTSGNSSNEPDWQPRPIV